MGKIREMIASVTLPDDPETKEMTDQAFSLISIGSQMGAHYDGAYSWSMTAYMNQVNSIDNDDGKEAQDELERSIVANLADEVTVSIVGSEVEVIIFKSYN